MAHVLELLWVFVLGSSAVAAIVWPEGVWSLRFLTVASWLVLLAVLSGVCYALWAVWNAVQ